MKQKLAPGTKVRVKEHLVVDYFYDGFRFHNGMSKHRGKTATIMGSPHYSENVYQIDIDKEGYDWSAYMFEVLKEESE